MSEKLGKEKAVAEVYKTVLEVYEVEEKIHNKLRKLDKDNRLHINNLIHEQYVREKELLKPKSELQRYKDDINNYFRNHHFKPIDYNIIPSTYEEHGTFI